MRRAIIVIGSNYGDEGKGMAAYSAARRLEQPCLNILINGGPQRGHTVETSEGCRHVFHHFGSGSVAGAATYLDADFMVNPLIFEQERERLLVDFPDACLCCIADPACRVTMPYDMMLNQIIEDARGAQRHGSCGFGIFETRHRYEKTEWAMRWGQLIKLDYSRFSEYCHRISEEYVAARLEEQRLKCPEQWIEILRSEGLIEHTWQDLQQMYRHTETCKGWDDVSGRFTNLIFEAGQGLALDEGYIDRNPHLTPSHTTSLISAKRIADLCEPCQTEVWYITRSYLTRHGAGFLPGECPMSDISPDIVDHTNMPNAYQQTIRYGRFDSEAVRGRILTDLEETRHILPTVKAVAVVTHLNETNGELFGTMKLQEFAKGFDGLCCSDSPYDIDICKACAW